MASVRRHPRRLRGIAALTAAWLVVLGVLAMRHEAHVAHVRDGAGGYVHAIELAGVHAGGASDVHGERGVHGDAAQCALLTAFHQAAAAATVEPRPVVAVRQFQPLEPVRLTRAVPPARVYRLAPKTSPPRA